MEGGRDAIEGAKSVLRTLKELLEDGLISKQEYEAQKEKELGVLFSHTRKQGAKTTELEATSTGQEGTNTAAMATEAEVSRSGATPPVPPPVTPRSPEVARQEGEGRSSKRVITITRTTDAYGKRRREEYERRRREEEREVIGGREKRRRERSRGSWDDVGRRVEVWRLPKAINAGGVKAMFRGVGTVTEAVVHTQDGSPKARATVTFADSSQAERAVRKMHGKLIEGIGNIGVKMLAPENGYEPRYEPRYDSRYDSRDPRYDSRYDSRYR
ncbi:hypothetical protein HKI87_06g40170 [Chloropicon roscoffensis]|uniref:RRM domain-containing protein n=1 Tax=Chloropicon roscoffensis TaxID=1461544 RepID=A0AAX4PAB0_9CHLO